LVRSSLTRERGGRLFISRFRVPALHEARWATQSKPGAEGTPRRTLGQIRDRRRRVKIACIERALYCGRLGTTDRRVKEPIIEVERHGSATGKGTMPARTGRMRLRRWRRRLVAALAILVALPLVLPFVYLIPGTRPVSTLMISELVTFNGYDRRWVPI